ncbi:MAG: hypothetical protein NTW96_01065 [Planctomycetia bacterium]|nr:hypothetical protein [Planctomycetia bacterium]
MLLLVAVARTSAAVEYAITDLGTLGTQQPRASYAMDVNDAGQVIGAARRDDLTLSLFLWDAQNGMQDLEIPAFGDIYSLNNSGQIAGTARDIGGFVRSSATDIRQLSSPDNSGPGAAFGINDLGVAVGYATVGATHQFPACLWDAEGNGQYLGIFDGVRSRALDINNAGQVVGWSGGYSPDRGGAGFPLGRNQRNARTRRPRGRRLVARPRDQ